MPFRTRNTVSSPGSGTTNFRTRTHTGKGGAPAGTRQVAAPKPSEVPVTTVSPSGQITTRGFSSQQAARRAVRRQQAARRSERRKTRALNLSRRSAARQRRITSQNEARFKQPKAVVAPASVKTAPKLNPAPKLSPATKSYLKPKTFKGRGTAGSPSLKELQVGFKQGKLKTNQRGYLTTPAVRKTVARVKGLES